MRSPLFDKSARGNYLDKRDFFAGTAVALLLLIAWTLGSSGGSLIATFVPGVASAWCLFALLYVRRIALPAPAAFLPLYYLGLGWQCIHFAEELMTGFNSRFPAMYGGAPYRTTTFVIFNLASYLVFAISPPLVYMRGRRFLMVPLLFFVVYGMVGNAVAHTYWSLRSGGYFPGLYTSLPYWVLGPYSIFRILRSATLTLAFVAAFAILLLALLTALLGS